MRNAHLQHMRKATNCCDSLNQQQRCRNMQPHRERHIQTRHIVEALAPRTREGRNNAVRLLTTIRMQVVFDSTPFAFTVLNELHLLKIQRSTPSNGFKRTIKQPHKSMNGIYYILSGQDHQPDQLFNIHPKRRIRVFLTRNPDSGMDRLHSL